MKPNEMSLEACAVELGLVEADCQCEECMTIAVTLDAIAACMPEGWDWTREYVAMDGDPSEIKWLACSSHYASMIGIPDTGDEKLDRARLAVACRMAVKEKP